MKIVAAQNFDFSYLILGLKLQNSENYFDLKKSSIPTLTEHFTLWMQTLSARNVKHLTVEIFLHFLEENWKS